ncbi:MAG: ribonuclease HII [Candidatus Merdivicinus sp.]
MTLYEYDRSLALPPFCGVDEAGRGPLAGDVYAAAVILPLGEEIPGINDSKKLSEKKRDALYDEIVSRAEAWAVGIATVEEIEKLNILQAAMLAMRRAVEALPVPPVMALVDGNKNPSLPVPSRCLVKGDGTSASVAAASIIAKVSRDRYMAEMDRKYPGYLFAKHKGYGSKEHYSCLDRLGPSPIHRMSFLKKYYAKKAGEPHLDAGGRGEAAASQRLAEKGFQILEADWHSRWGEIDLIAADGETLVFCEVKTRLEDSVGAPREAVGPAKRKKLTETALCYLSEHPSELQPRFDVIEVTLSRADGAVLSVEHLENAFPAEQ